MSRPFPSGKPANYAKISNDTDGEEDDYVQRERNQQQMEREKQDESLDQLHTAVKRLGDMSLSISTELDSQNAMLDDLNEETDKASEALQAVTKKTKELIEQSGASVCMVVRAING
ncbi:hypothetical protein FI667_g7374, partial [Globisporangium splendens]